MKLGQLLSAALFSLAVMTCNLATAEEMTFSVEVEAGKHARQNVPVRTLVEVPAALAEVTSAQLRTADGKTITAQLSTPRLLAEAKQAGQGNVVRELTFVLERLAAGETATFQVTIGSGEGEGSAEFAWHDTAGNYNELRFGDRPVLRYMYEPLDDSSKANRERTYKVFHHVFSPSGDAIITKGAGGQFTHHRGVYYGFMKCIYDGDKKADTWHCTGDSHQSHQDFLASAVGPLFGRHRLAVDWHGQQKKVFANEQRELTAYQLPGGTLIEFASRLKGTNGAITLDGDPQHAGFQFRASNEVAEKNAKQTYYVRPDGTGKPGQTRNWPHDQRMADLPWNAMSFVVGGKRYTAAYLDKPTNPKEARYSERDYGRFGSYFVHEIPAGEVLDVNYRLWIQEGELTPEQVAALSADFVEPPQVTVK